MTETLSSVNLDAALSKGGAAAAGLTRLWESLWQQDHVPPALLELCRLNFARLYNDTAELGAAMPYLPTDAVTADRRQAVIEGKAHDSALFSEAEKAALFFAEYYWMDAQSITDEAADAVKAHFGEPGLVLLIEALGCIDARIRTARCLRDMAAFAPAMEATYVR
ncbi:hypothetical protein [Sphingobium estronivorans]|uniref:hypothetical protein n=1 Tax=Sphingobium estronivorans TaxID=1577690 RepID=UPI00123A8E14|nr:hypothetical protein [Sphingobium estronivorans]